MKLSFLSLFTYAFLCVSLIFAQDSTNEFPPGVTAYIKLQPRNSELIICEKSSSSTPSQLKSIVSTFLTDDEQIQRFLEKGFLFKTKNENCTGMLYHSQPEIIKHISLTKFRQQLPNYVQENFNKHATSDSNLDIKIEGKDNTIVITFISENVELGFPRTSKGGSARYGKLPDKKESNNTSVVKGVVILQGKGLHQNMTKKLRIEDNGTRIMLDKGKKCSIVLLDVLSEQTYVDQDEIRGLEYMDLKRFEVLDIEKPTETAKQYVWIVKMDVDDLIERSRSFEELVISYLVHFRYQNPKEEPFSDSHLLLKTKFFSDCGYGDTAGKDTGDSIFYQEKVKELYGEEFKQLVFEQSTIEGGQTDEIIVKVPVGDIKLKGIVTIVTLVVSIGGAVAILLFILGFGQKEKRD